jgi:hypothetical protein
MLNPRIDTTSGDDGNSVVHACFDLSGAESGAAAHAVATASVERYRTAEMTADDVVTMRELTALADALAELAREEALQPVRMLPARLSALRDALAEFVEGRDSAEYVREEDREPLATLRPLLWPLDELCTQALHAALRPAAPAAY